MAEIAQRRQDQLDRIKENVEKAYEYFKPNYDRWHKFKKFLYVTNLDHDDLAVLNELKKPQIEFNILEAYVSRQKGEFSKQEPSIKVGVLDGAQVDPAILDFNEGYVRKVELNMRNSSVADKIYDDMLSGSYSVGKVFTDYSNEMSFDQDIKVERVFDPTLCGFDPLARLPHKGDGEYCFELFPKRKHDFEEEYPGIDISTCKFSKTIEGFNWSYKTNKEEILLICEYYEKKKKRTKIVKLSNNQVMTEANYEKFLIEWEMSGRVEQAPIVVGEPRFTMLTTVVRYRFIENQVISYKETNYGHLPLVFFDGDSVLIRQTNEGPIEQITRPYCYQAIGVQRLKNFCGQTLANEIENMVQHKFMIPKEGIPQEYVEAYTDFQTPNTIVYNQFKDDDPNVRLDPPREVQRVPTPPEVTATFMGADQTTQTILGTYDAALGINKNQLSGVAIIEGATQSNAAAMPFIVNYLAGLNQIGQIVVDLIPKYITSPRNVSIVDKNNKEKAVPVNSSQGLSLKYDSSPIKITVQAGVNFAIQKTRALQQIVALMQASPAFADFMNNAGLPILLDNIEMRGSDKLKEMAEQYMQQKQQSQAQNMQQEMQMNPVIVKAKLDGEKLQQDAVSSTRDAQIKMAQVGVQAKQADTGRLKVLADIQNTQQQNELAADKVVEERVRSAVDMGIKAADMSHKHNKEALELANKTNVTDMG